MLGRLRRRQTKCAACGNEIRPDQKQLAVPGGWIHEQCAFGRFAEPRSRHRPMDTK